MSPEVVRAAVLVGFALVLLLVNALARETWLKLVTIVPMIGFLATAGLILARWAL